MPCIQHTVHNQMVGSSPSADATGLGQRLSRSGVPSDALRKTVAHAAWSKVGCLSDQWSVCG
ncbi:hypothetical protein J1614_007151 [Plenodomus biglobosus]|nr:hypothetical protein J1614_007151 [Plenodomus biglobosus]